MQKGFIFEAINQKLYVMTLKIEGDFMRVQKEYNTKYAGMKKSRIFRRFKLLKLSFIYYFIVEEEIVA